MKTSYKMFAVASAGYIFAAAGAAQAAVTVDGYSLDTGSFGTGLGVHSTGTQSGTTLDGVVNTDGSAVTFSSTDMLSMTGSGEATVLPLSGAISNLDVLFEKAWDNITFSFAGDDGTFSMLVNGTSQFSVPACTICTIGTGQNKFTLSGSGITSLSFAFTPGVGTAKQFRVEGLTSAVPEPATWALFLLAFAGIGGVMRTRRRHQRVSVKYT
jgi:hypothetical protein